MSRNYKFSKNSKKELSTCVPSVQTIATRAMEIANERKLFCPDWGVSSGKRSTDEQFDMFRKGRSMIVKDKGSSEYAVVDQDKVVTYADGYNIKSDHQTGLAFDIYCYVDGVINYEIHNMLAVATCIFQAASELGVKIVWGGTWKSFTDTPHFKVVL